jgi:hypothetical protein
MNQPTENLFSIKNHKGEWLTLKRSSYVFQHDNEHRLLEYLNHFTIVAFEKLQPPSNRVMDNYSNRMFHVEEEMANGVRSIIEQSGLFIENKLLSRNLLFLNEI